MYVIESESIIFFNFFFNYVRTKKTYDDNKHVRAKFQRLFKNEVFSLRILFQYFD